MVHPKIPTKKRHRVSIASAGILLAGFLLPAVAVHFTVAPPQTRRIHMDLFRYGMVPSVIHAARGDTIIMTFASRDTPQSFFLQEYDLDVKVSPNTGEVDVVHPSDPEGEPETMREVVIHAGRPGLAGFFNTKSRYRGHVYSGAMHGFEQGFFVVHPNYLHAGAIGLLAAIPIAMLYELRRRRSARDGAGASGGNPEAGGAVAPGGTDPGPEQLSVGEEPSGIDLFERWPRLRAFLGTQGLQFWLMSGMSVLMYVILLTSLLGTRMAGGNLGVLLLWVVWLFALVVLLVPLFGRAWCTICPIPMAGDALQRGTTVGVRGGRTSRYNNRFNGLMLRWPASLSTAVPRTLVFLCFGTVSVLIISQPRWTGWALVLLIAKGTILPLLFEHRSFCRFLCPINSFLSLYARMGRIALRARHRNLCERCVKQEIVTCERGNEHGWACPYGLAVHEIDDNADCGLCMECVRSCHYQNISLRWRPFGLDRLLRRRDEALQAIVMFALAIDYCLIFQGPWYGLRDMVNIVDKGNWDLFAVYTAVLWVVVLGLIPFLLKRLTELGTRLSRTSSRAVDLYPASISPLVPMGLFLWIAFAFPMLMVQGSFILSTLSDPFGWGWDLFGTAGHPWIQLLPEAIPWIQTITVLVGFSFALRAAYRVWSGAAGDTRRAVSGMFPIGLFLFAVSAGMIWFFAA